MGTRREALAQRRIACGLSQEALAELVGVDRSTVARWELGASGPQPLQRPRLAKALRLGLDDCDLLLAGSTATEGLGATPPRSSESARPNLDLLDLAAQQGLTSAVHAATALDPASVADVFETVADLAREYGDRRRLETFLLAGHCRETVQQLTGRTARVTDLADLYLLASLTNGLMASAAFDLSRWHAAMTLGRAARTWAGLSCHPSAIGWAHGLLAAFLNWRQRPEQGVAEIERALAHNPGAAASYRLHSIAARSYAQLGNRDATRNALEHAARHQAGLDGAADLLHDQLGGEFRFDVARAEACAGAAWLQLGDGAEAEPRLASAIGAYTALPEQERPVSPMAGARADLASACLLRGDLDAAEHALADVLAIAPEQRISVITARVSGVEQRLRQSPWRQVCQAAGLADEISDWLVGTPVLPSAQ